MNKVIFEAKNISKSFLLPRSGFLEKKEHTTVLRNVSLSLEKGTIMGIVGESGSGKTTLGRIMAKLLSPDDGMLFYNGINITELTPRGFKPYRKNIQMIFQNPYASLNPNKTIGWLLKESLDINTKLSTFEKLSRVDEMLELVGLMKTLKSRYPHELSGGERQRAAIAQALMLNPEIIIADEAVSALDVSVSAQILNLLNELKEKLNLSYIFISHDLAVVNYISDKIAVMKGGEIIENGLAETIFTNPQKDYTKKLLAGTFIYEPPS